MAVNSAYRTPRGLTEEMKAQLAKQGNVVLATIDDDGRPHLTELLFLLDDRDRVQMPTPHTTRKYRNLERRPVATVFFYDQPGWISATGSVELWTGERAAEANQRNRERLLTPGGHQTIGRLLEASENTTIVLTPERWLSWSGRAMMPEIERLGGDLQANPPDTWFRDLG
jgi:nitroimidazol reductase NimA-like FMN-containing flavoprotein (pyridoxamine 5'-phosphate oxidase superfamily)